MSQLPVVIQYKHSKQQKKSLKGTNQSIVANSKQNSINKRPTKTVSFSSISESTRKLSSSIHVEDTQIVVDKLM